VEKSKNRVVNFLYEFMFLFSRPLYVGSFCLNMVGSVLFYVSLSSHEVSQTVPIANTLTIVISTIVGKLLGEEGDNLNTYMGMALVMIGLALMCS